MSNSLAIQRKEIDMLDVSRSPVSIKNVTLTLLSHNQNGSDMKCNAMPIFKQDISCFLWNAGSPPIQDFKKCTNKTCTRCFQILKVQEFEKDSSKSSVLRGDVGVEVLFYIPGAFDAETTSLGGSMTLIVVTEEQSSLMCTCPYFYETLDLKPNFSKIWKTKLVQKSSSLKKTIDTIKENINIELKKELIATSCISSKAYISEGENCLTEKYVTATLVFDRMIILFVQRSDLYDILRWKTTLLGCIVANVSDYMVLSLDSNGAALQIILLCKKMSILSGRDLCRTDIGGKELLTLMKFDMSFQRQEVLEKCYLLPAILKNFMPCSVELVEAAYFLEEINMEYSSLLHELLANIYDAGGLTRSCSLNNQNNVEDTRGKLKENELLLSKIISWCDMPMYVDICFYDETLLDTFYIDHCLEDSLRYDCEIVASYFKVCCYLQSKCECYTLEKVKKQKGSTHRTDACEEGVVTLKYKCNDCLNYSEKTTAPNYLLKLKKSMKNSCCKCCVVHHDETALIRVQQKGIQSRCLNYFISNLVKESYLKVTIQQKCYLLELLASFTIYYGMINLFFLFKYTFGVVFRCAEMILRFERDTIQRSNDFKSPVICNYLALYCLMSYSTQDGYLYKALHPNAEQKMYDELKLAIKCLTSSYCDYSERKSIDVLKSIKSRKAFLYDIINWVTPCRDDTVQIYPISNPLDMSNEMMRLGSLSKFPDDNRPSFIRLAQLGFYSEGKGRELLCHLCGKGYDNWSYYSNPYDIHCQISPDCQYTTGQAGQTANSMPRSSSIFDRIFRIEDDSANHPNRLPITNDSLVPGASANSSQQKTRTPQIDFGSVGVSQSCTDSSETSQPTILISSSATPQFINGNHNSGHLSSDSGFHGSSTLSFGSRSNVGSFNRGLAHNSAFVTSLSTGAESGYGSGKSGSSTSSGFGSAGSGLKSGYSTGSSGYGSISSNSSSSSGSNASNLTHSQLPTVAEDFPGNVQNNTRSGQKEKSSSQNIPKEKYPEYIDIAKRRASYKTWPKHLLFLHPLDLAECGFFYSNFGDCVRCYHCGIGLRNWEREDNPWVEHARWSKKCPYLRQKKGQEFIDQVLTMLGLQTDAEVEQQISGATATPSVQEKPSDVKDPILHPAALLIIQEKIFGDIKERTLKKAMNQLLQQHEWDDITTERLVEFLLENKENIEASETKTNQANMSESAEPTSQAQSGSSREENPAPSDADPDKIQKENDELKDLYTCKICLDEKVGITFVPCGHLVTCKNCSPKIKRCPLCRTFIRGTIKTTI